MNPLIYFLPGDKRAATDADLEAVGLGHATGPRGVMSLRHESGPGGTGGVLVIANDADGNCDVGLLRYQPDAQTWRKGPKGAYWVGFRNDRRPGPADLARPELYEGQDVTLLDGNVWVAPRCVAQLKGRSIGLPKVLDLADDGETLMARVHPRYKDLCERAYDLWLAFSNQAGGRKLTAAEEVRLAVDALAVNYRVGMVEAVGLLGLLDTDGWHRVLRAMIDADEVEAYYRALPTVDDPSAAEGDDAKKPEAAAT